MPRPQPGRLLPDRSTGTAHRRGLLLREVPGPSGVSRLVDRDLPASRRVGRYDREGTGNTDRRASPVRPAAAKGLGPMCTVGRAHESRGLFDQAKQFHATCTGLRSGCGCRCHAEEQMSIEEVVAASKRRRLIAAGIDPDLPASKRRRTDRPVCIHGHPLDGPDALGPNGQCRACRRDDSRRYKQRQREEAEGGQESVA